LGATIPDVCADENEYEYEYEYEQPQEARRSAV
jgi:hypothetical protein